jgi:hypothetical protein
VNNTYTDAHKRYYQNHKAEIKARRLLKKAEYQAYGRKSYKKNRIKKLAQKKIYFQSNKAKISARQSARFRIRRKTEINFRLRDNLRARLTKVVRCGGAIRNLGCSIEEFKLHLSALFKDSMSWDNYGRGVGRWSIDHIKPLSKFNLENMEELRAACHYNNMQPMWNEENSSKGGL